MYMWWSPGKGLCDALPLPLFLKSELSNYQKSREQPLMLLNELESNFEAVHAFIRSTWGQW